MHPYTDHAAFVFDHPDDKAAALALVDHYEEVWDTTHRAALKSVALHRVNARRQATTRRAATYLASAHRFSRFLWRLIVCAADPVELEAVTVLVDGFKPPTYVHHPGGQEEASTYASSSILVGARWVLQVVRCVHLHQSGKALLAAIRTPHRVTLGEFGRALRWAGLN